MIGGTIDIIGLAASFQRRSQMVAAALSCVSTQNAIINATGIAPKRFRAPYGIGGVTGKVHPKIQAAAAMYNLTVVYWDVDTRDWSNNQGLNARVIAASVEQAKGRVKRTNGRPINILMHVQASTAKGLPFFTKALKEAGFSFADPPP